MLVVMCRYEEVII